MSQITNSIPKAAGQQTVFAILFAIASAHFMNDMMQAIIPSLYPMLKENYHLSFTQIGFITFSYQVTASLLQPFVGSYTDKFPKPYSLAFAMICTFLGVLSLAFASSYVLILCSCAIIGIGSSIFHPEASRVAFLASGGRRGLAQSIFQLGGNFGTAVGPLLVALYIMPHTQIHVLKFLVVAVVGFVVLTLVGRWYKKQLEQSIKKAAAVKQAILSPQLVKRSIAILLVLIFSKAFYLASMTNYYAFFLMHKFALTAVQAQYYLFMFLGAVALGTLIGGPIGDKIGRKYVIWISILGTAPFALLLPYASLQWTFVLSIIIGLILSSAFSAILVFAQELMPNKVGTLSGLFFGFSFGMGGLGSAVLGYFADLYSIESVYAITAFLPLIGIITYFLPNVKNDK
ncbi:MAG: MFS transporter [Flavobacterium sp.]|nr:MFS transporter [Candidatus Neoflavobacterium equi]